MLYAYALSPLAPGGPVRPKDGIEGGPAFPARPSFRALKTRAAAILDRLEPPGSLVSRRILERLAALNSGDIKLAHSFCARLEKKLIREN
jgi:hypothetical protein